MGEPVVMIERSAPRSEGLEEASTESSGERLSPINVSQPVEGKGVKLMPMADATMYLWERIIVGFEEGRCGTTEQEFKSESYGPCGVSVVERQEVSRNATIHRSSCWLSIDNNKSK
jgi:hypothetical protein